MCSKHIQRSINSSIDSFWISSIKKKPAKLSQKLFKSWIFRSLILEEQPKQNVFANLADYCQLHITTEFIFKFWELSADRPALCKLEVKYIKTSFRKSISKKEKWEPVAFLLWFVWLNTRLSNEMLLKKLLSSLNQMLVLKYVNGWLLDSEKKNLLDMNWILLSSTFKLIVKKLKTAQTQGY